MRITREDSTDLGMVMYCLTFGAINTDDVSSWASRAIDEEDDPPIFLYTMLDLRGLFGKELRSEIGFEAGAGLRGDREFDYIRQIAVRRGLRTLDYLGPAINTRISKNREKYINDLFMLNFGVDVDQLPKLDLIK